MTDTPTPYEAMRLFAEGLLEELEDEHSCTEVGLYRQTLADIQDEAEAATRSTPAEALPNDHACDWPGCAGQCHTGSTCPCHPSTPAEPFDEAQAWADMAARRGDPELGTPAAPTPLRALHDAYYAVPAGEPTAEQIMENLPDLYAAIERVLEDAGRISGMLATVDEAERNGLTVHLATRRTCREHIKAGDDHA